MKLFRVHNGGNIMQYSSARAMLAAVAALLLILPALGRAQDEGAQHFTPEQLQAGTSIYARNCSACHGPRMLGPEAFDLRTFPHDQHTRFITSVTQGKNGMPPWGGLLSAEDIENLWAYVLTSGER